MIPNSQPISKRDQRDDGLLLVHSMFMTIQGEGPFAGDPAVFIRLAGCNMQCPNCDTEYTNGAKFADPEDLVRTIQAKWGEACTRSDKTLVVITGGEPFRQNIGPLVRKLLAKRMRVQVETNGSFFLEDYPYGHPRETIVCSPKSSKLPKQLLNHIDAYKYVLTEGEVDPEDGLPTTSLGLKNRPARPHSSLTQVYVNPLDTKDLWKNNRNQRLVAEVCLKHGYRMGIQLHKFIGYE